MKLRGVVFGLVCISVIHSGCATRAKPEVSGKGDYSDKAEVEQAKHIATKVLYLKFDSIPKIGSEGNFFAIKSKSVLFSHRLDSRTYFVHDVRYGIGKKAGVFKGSDKELMQFSRDVLQKTGYSIVRN